MTDKTTDVTVTPEDREAAIAFGDWTGRTRADLNGPAIRAGEWDHTEDVQAFARHRTASEQPASGEVGRLREALAALATAEAEYRHLHDLHGDSDMRTGRAWDWMRRKGDEARTALSPPCEGAGK